MGIDKALVTDRNAIDETNDTIEQEGQAEAGMQSQLSSIGMQRKRTTKARFIQTEDENAWLTIGLNNPYKLAWDIFVILLAVYNCLMIPLSFSFQPAFLQSLTGVDKEFYPRRAVQELIRECLRAGTIVQNSKVSKTRNAENVGAERDLSDYASILLLHVADGAVEGGVREIDWQRDRTALLQKVQFQAPGTLRWPW